MKFIPSHVVLLITLLFSNYAPPAVASNALLGMLTSQLGVSEQQAHAGMKAIMDLAQQHLSTADYKRILTAVPDLGIVITPAPAAATPAGPAASVATAQPAVAKDSGMTGALLDYASSWMGASSVGQMAQLAQIFSQLGLSTDMVAKFIQIALTYANSTGGQEIMGLLAGALKF